ncbi:MAG: hypothetical protein A3K03_03405 [Bdellovibrionales bacterium RIFOXYD1_FULL_44_7]|nr:MAG: hypothetical protein A3K03_03405 [Bdellovibrionales bacterium RIFOXYD1_FULL_44_7]
MEIFSFEQEAREAIQPALQSTQALLLPVLPAQVVLRVLELAVVQQVVEQQEQVVNHHPLRRMERMGEVFHQGLLVAVLLDQKRRIEKINSLVLVHI